MREILFRGKKIDDKEWFHGNLLKLNKKTYLVPQNTWFDYGRLKVMVEVDPETVGQYTGLTDKDNKQIFEGDIIKNTWTGDIHTVDWCVDCAVWVLPCVTDERRETTFNSYSGDDYMIIGNIHDNPELLKGGAE